MKISFKRKRGMAYTVTEVLMAVGICGGVLTGVLSGFSLAFNVLQGVRENLRATQILQEKMETVRLYSWDQINTAGFIPGTFTASINPTNQTSGTIYNGTIRIDPVPFVESYSSNLVQVQVQVRWDSGGVNHNRKMTTFVSRYGLQNYIY